MAMLKIGKDETLNLSKKAFETANKNRKATYEEEKLN